MPANSTEWKGRTRFVPWVLAPILLFSLVAWALGITFTVGAENTTPQLPNPNVNPSRIPSTASLYFYACTMPMISTVASAIELGLYHVNALLPVLSLTWALVAAIGWLTQWIIWLLAEMADSGIDGFNLYYFPNRYGTNTPSGVPGGVWEARLAFGFIVFIAYVVYVVYAAVAVHKNRRSVAVDAELKGAKRVSSESS